MFGATIRVYNIKWDTDGDNDAFQSLPKEVFVSVDMEGFEDEEAFDEALSEFLSNHYGFCHFGYWVDRSHQEQIQDGSLIEVYDDRYTVVHRYPKSPQRSIKPLGFHGVWKSRHYRFEDWHQALATANCQ